MLRRAPAAARRYVACARPRGGRRSGLARFPAFCYFSQSMAAGTAVFKESAGVVYHGGALLYALAAWGAGLAGLFSGSPAVNAVAVLALAHGMTIAAYMIHEAAHNTVFRDAADNVRLGRFLTWICGASYGTFEDIRYKHLRHHVDNDDVVWFDYERFFRDHPAILRVTRALEWCYIPAHDLIMHAVLTVGAFVIPERRDQRVRTATVIAIRGGLFLAALVLATRAALLYALAYVLMIHVLRFMDSLQHDYEYHTNLYTDERSERRGDAAWEQEHTFSVPLTLSFPWVNWLTLNFGFHNAHHARPVVPWYRLPALHREMFGDDPRAVVPLGAQLRIMHRGRVDRVIKWGAGGEDVPTPEGRDFLRAARAARVTGGNAASFLTSI